MAEKSDGSTMGSKVDLRRVQSAERVRLIDDETNRLRDAAGERARSIDAKSSFLAVTAGVILMAAFTRTDSATAEYWLRLLPIAFAVLAIAAAAVALRPASRREVSPDSLYLRWADTEKSLAVVERDLLLQKICAYQVREHDLKWRARTASIGFIFLLLSSAALLFSYI